MPKKSDTLQSIELADGVEIRNRMAGLFVRSAAWMIDVSIQVGILLFLAMTVGALLEAATGDFGEGLFLIMLFVVIWFYNVYFEVRRNGATPGKKAMGLKVVQVSGVPVRTSHSVVRNFVRIIDGLPVLFLFDSEIPTYGLGAAVCLFTRNFQRLGDIAAGTVVIYAKEHEIAGWEYQDAVPVRPLHNLLRDEQRALVTFLERAPMLSEARRIEMADHASALTGETGPDGVVALLGMGAWVRDSG